MQAELRLQGRTHELAALLALTERAAAGQAQLVLVQGEAGIGKSRLVQELTQRWRALGRPSCRGGCGALSGPETPFGPFTAALRAHRRGAAAGWFSGPGDERVSVASRHRRFEAMLDVLSGLTADGPLLLVLEDLHWCDHSSRALLDFLAVNLGDEPVAVVATVRTSGPDAATRAWTAELARRPQVDTVALPPLADDVVRRMVQASGAKLTVSAVARVVGLAGGNPLHALELAAGAPDTVPASLADAVLARRAALAEPARALLDLLAVHDAPLPHGIAEAALGSPPDTLTAAGRQAREAGLLAAGTDGYLLPHALVRQVMHERLLPGERRDLHRRLAEAVAADPRLDERARVTALALHWSGADVHVHAWPAERRAAEQAMADGAYAEAERLFVRARGHALAADAGWRVAVELLLASAAAAKWAGSPSGAVAYAGEALDTLGRLPTAEVDTLLQATALERLGRYEWDAGHPRAALEADAQAGELLRDRPPSALQARVLAAHAAGRMIVGEFAAAGGLAREARRVAVGVQAAAEESYALAVLGVVEAHDGRLDVALDALGRAQRVAEAAADPEAVLRAATNAAYVECTAGRFGDALGTIGRGTAVARRLGVDDNALSFLAHTEAAVLTATGRWDEALVALAELPTTDGVSSGYRGLLRLEITWARGERADPDELAHVRRCADGDDRIRAHLAAAQAESLLWDGEPGRAWDDARGELERLPPGTVVDGEARLLAVGARALADLAVAGRSAAGGTPVPRPDWEVAAAGTASRAAELRGAHAASDLEVAACAALVEAELRRGHGVDARGDWETAAAAWQRAGQPYRVAYTHLRAAGLAAGRSRRDQARRSLQEALPLARKLRAGPMLAELCGLAARARLTAELAAAGTVTARAATPHGLTARELQVLAELAGGATNRQISRTLFISERTVAVHVSHILDKLPARNRAEAAAAATRLTEPIAARRTADACSA